MVRKKVPVSPMTPPCLTDADVLVSQTCRRAHMSDQAVRPSAQPLAKFDNAELPARVRVRDGDCLSNCKNDCTIFAGRGQRNLNIRKHQSSVGF